MDGDRFDALTKRLFDGTSRRRLLAGLAGGLATVFAPLAGEAGRDGPTARQCRRRGKKLCGKRCRNLSTNERHCGACRNRCAPGQQCIDGGCTECTSSAQCQAPVGGTATCTNGRCVVSCPDARPNVCGAAPGTCQECCDNDDCFGAEVCTDGRCVACPPAQTCGSGASAVCCDANQACSANGQCVACPSSRLCGSGASAVCCDANQACSANGRCVACPAAQVCGTGANAVCCTAAQACINNQCAACPVARACGTPASPTCCAADEVCAGTVCVPACTQCGTDCCTAGETCIGPAGSESCCANGSLCGGPLPADQICCASNETCTGTIPTQSCQCANPCGTDCCTAGETCIGPAGSESCCANGSLCGGPLPADQICCADNEECVGVIPTQSCEVVAAPISSGRRRSRRSRGRRS